MLFCLQALAGLERKKIEEELKELGKKFFVRLIKTIDINHTEDLEELFK